MKLYPKYKPSGIDWIGNIPDHWKIKKIKHTSYVKGRIGWQGLTSNEYIDDGPLLVTGTDFTDGTVNWSTCYHVSYDRYMQDPYIQLKEDDLLITKDGTIGKVALVKHLPDNATLNSGIFLIRPINDSYTSDLMYWILNSNIFTGFIDYNRTGTTINHLYQETFIDFPFVAPPIEEQDAIVGYLNKITKRVDSTIEKKQKLIELLGEQRAATINQAVTKGLNPDVKMKDSGVEWLGEVPEHWEVKKIKHISSVISKGTTPSTLGRSISDAGSVRFLKAENINSNLVSCPPDFFIDEETNEILKRSQLKEYDILFVIAGATIGKVAILEGEYLPANTNQAVSFIRLNDITDAEFICYWLQSSRINELTWLYAVQAAQPNLSMENLGNFFMPYPTPEERKGIVSFIKSETAKIDSTITRIEREVGLLQEYRVALISEAVTGKIDVREE